MDGEREGDALRRSGQGSEGAATGAGPRMAAVAREARRLADVLRGLPHAAQPVPHLAWTVGETAAHVVLANRLWTDLAAGGTSPFTRLADFSHRNAAVLGGFAERDPARLADLVEESTRDLAGAVLHLPPGALVPWHFGARLEVQPWLGLVLNHLLVHAHDIGRGLGAPSTIGAADARVAIDGIAAAMPFLHRESGTPMKGSLLLHVRGGTRYLLRFGGGVLTVERPSGRAGADCHLSVEPVAFLLVANRRRGLWGPTFAGRMVAWGRKPWLALRLPAALPSP